MCSFLSVWRFLLFFICLWTRSVYKMHDFLPSGPSLHFSVWYLATCLLWHPQCPASPTQSSLAAPWLCSHHRALALPIHSAWRILTLVWHHIFSSSFVLGHWLSVTSLEKSFLNTAYEIPTETSFFSCPALFFFVVYLTLLYLCTCYVCILNVSSRGTGILFIALSSAPRVVPDTGQICFKWVRQ